jgi:hypothetical protein
MPPAKRPMSGERQWDNENPAAAAPTKLLIFIQESRLRETVSKAIVFNWRTVSIKSP